MNWLTNWFSKRAVKFSEKLNSWIYDGMETGSGIYVSEGSAIQIAAVWACVRVLAETLATIPVMVYERKGNDSRELARNHPAYKLLHDRPGLEQTSFEFFETSQGHLTLRGNSYAQKIFRAGRVAELIPFHPDRVRMDRDSKGRLVYELELGNGVANKTFPADRILHVKAFSSNGVKGLSMISNFRETLGAQIAMEQHGSRLFKNGTHLGGMLSHPGKLSDIARANLETSLKNKYSGIGNVGKNLILEEGMTFEKVGMTSEDAQYIESRKFGINEIARIFRVPPHMIADLERATFSNIEHMSLNFLTYTMMPWLRRWEQALNYAIIPADEQERFYIEFNPAALLRADIKTRYASYAIGRQWGWLSANDVLQLENRNSIGEKGNIYMVPTNMWPADKIMLSGGTTQPGEEEED
jgi:HK97 family phage portal protein